MNFDEKCNIYEHFDVQLQTFTCVCGMKFNKNEVKLIIKKKKNIQTAFVLSEGHGSHLFLFLRSYKTQWYLHILIHVKITFSFLFLDLLRLFQKI